MARLDAILSGALAVLVLLCTLTGVLVPNFYRRVPAVLLPGTFGQDWTSLAAVPVLLWATRAGVRGSRRGKIVWAGLLTYYLYGYALYAFGPQLTVLYPLYVLIVGVSAFALIRVSMSLDVPAFASRLRGHIPARRIATLFVGIVVVLAPVWVAMMIATIQTGAPSPFTTIHVLDLAFVFPALLITALGLRRQQPWSYLLAGPLLILSATMMGSLVISEAIAALRFTPDPVPLTIVFGLVALAATLLASAYLRVL
jgi:hypothetical protein